MITTLVIHDGPQGTITYLSGADRWEAFSPTGRYLGEFPTNDSDNWEDADMSRCPGFAEDN